MVCVDHLVVGTCVVILGKLCIVLWVKTMFNSVQNCIVLAVIVAGKQGIKLVKTGFENPDFGLCTAGAAGLLQRRGARARSYAAGPAQALRGLTRAGAAGRGCTGPRGSSPVLAF